MLGNTSKHTLYWLAFTSFSIIGGEIYDLYNVFWWYDMVLHTVAGVLLTATSILLIPSKTFKDVVFIGLIVTNFLVMWEFFEYMVDTYLDFNMQGDDLQDTMSDIFVGKVGAFITLVYYRWRR